MSENELSTDNTAITLSSVALIFCIIWALVGESDIKIVAVSIAFMYFLKAGIDMEMASRALHDAH